MSIATAIQAAQQKIANAYTTISNKGGTLPATQNLSNLATAINSISSGSSASLDALLDGSITTLESNTTSFNLVLGQPLYGWAPVATPYLQTVSLPNATYIVESAFNGLTNLRTVSIPSITELGEFSEGNYFAGCTSLTSVYMPNVTYIGSESFRNCSSITNIDTMFTSVTGIGYYGCANMTGLTSIHLPACRSYGNYAIANCTNVTSVDFSAATTVSIGACTGLSSLRKVWVPNTCTMVYGQASVPGFRDAPSNCVIYTNYASASALPSDGFPQYWNCTVNNDASSTLTVRYNSTYQEFLNA